MAIAGPIRKYFMAIGKCVNCERTNHYVFYPPVLSLGFLDDVSCRYCDLPVAWKRLEEYDGWDHHCNRVTPLDNRGGDGAQ